MKTDDGGPAFPVGHWQDDESKNGMSLQDYFAGQALAGMLGNEKSFEAIIETARAGQDYTTLVMAQVAYNRAQAMIAEKRRLEEGAD